MSWKKKEDGKKSRFPKDPEEERVFSELRRKYAYAVAYLLIKNIKQSELREYLEDEENTQRYESLKALRQNIIDTRPRSKQWVDKGFYLGLKIEDCDTAGDKFSWGLIVNDFIFKQKTQVVSNRFELDSYLDTIAKIMDSEKIWSDPLMAAFDFGERSDSAQYVGKKRAKKEHVVSSDQLMLESDGSNASNEQ